MANSLLGLIPTMQSLALLSENYSFMKGKKKDFIKQGMRNIVGTSLIKTTADII